MSSLDITGKVKSIAFIFPGWMSKHQGGAEWQLYLLSGELVKRNLRVIVITEKIRSGSLKEQYLDDKISYCYYTAPKLKLLSLIKALYLVFRNKADFYYVRAENRIFRTASGVICRFTKRKLIYALAGDDELNYNKFRISKSVSFPVKMLLKLDYGLVNMLTRRSEHMADMIITQTYYQKEELKKRKGLDSIVIRNSIKMPPDTSGHEASEKCITKDLILWIGNFRPVKQPGIFYEIAESLKNKNFRFIMIGDSQTYMTDNQNRIPENIEVKGDMSREQLSQYLMAARILVNTSKTEGFSNTFLEAWANGVYVVSLNSNPDSLLDGTLGYCAGGDLRKLIEKIVEITECNQLIEKEIRLKFKEISEDFDPVLNTTKFLHSIESIK